MNKYKNLAFNTIIFAIGTFGSKILMLFLTRLYTTYMPADMYGTKELIEITATFLIPIFSFSITDAIIRYGLDNDYDNHKVFSTACCIEIIGVLMLLLISPLLSAIPFMKGYTPYLIIYTCTSIFRQTCSNFVRARGFVKLFAADGIFTTLTFFVFNMVFISGFKMGIKGFLIAVIISDFISGVLLWVVGGLGNYFRLRYADREIMNIMIRFSLPLIPTTIMWTITGFSDRIFVKYMDGPKGLTGDTAAGIYTAASKVPNLVSLVTAVFFQAWNMSAIMENGKKGINKFYENVYDAYQSIMFIASAFLIFLMQPISAVLLNLSVHPEYIQAFNYTPGLIMGVLFMCLNQFLSSVYTTSQHTKNSFWTSFIATALNFIFNIALIKLYGIQGAVIATFISYAVCYIIRIADTRRYIYFRVNHSKTLVNVIIIFAMCMISIKQPNLYFAALFLLTAFVTLINFSAIKTTIRRALSRK